MAKKYQSSLSEQNIFRSSTFVQHEEIKKNITVLPELESLIPPLGEEEKTQLEANILKEGCREALLVWPTTESVVFSGSESQKSLYILVDGHNRFSICKKNNLDFQIHLTAYKSLEEAKGFMIDNQLGRRNLSTEQASYLRGMKYLNLRQSKGKYERPDHKAQNELYGLNEGESEHKAHFEPYAFSDKKQTTADRLAEEFKVGHATIKRDAEFAQGLEMLTPTLKSAILAGTTKIGKSTIQQLAKTPVTETPLDSLEAIENRLTPKKSAKVEKAVNAKQEDSLIIEINALISKLKNPKKRKEACEKLIELASRLQALS